jgi:tRNA pseudouridine55 synthase
LKRNGKPLYKYARQGVEVKIEPRKVNVFGIQLLSFTKDTVIIKVQCGKGTYIRSMARDIALELGTVGYLTSLTRTRIGNFEKDSAITIERIPNWLSTMV